MKELITTDFPILGHLDGDPVAKDQSFNDELGPVKRLNCSLFDEQEQGGSLWFREDLDTNKLVVISANTRGKWYDEALSLTLSPVMAAALVRRLIDTLDRVQRESSTEAVPSIHCGFTERLAASVFDGATLGQEDLDYYRELQSALYEATDGQSIASILPPALRK